MSQFVPVQNRTPEQLIAMSQPGNSSINGIRMPFYDTQLFTSGSSGAQLTFFQAINADKTMSNVKGNGGTMPNNYYFEPLTMCMDVLADASLAGASTEVGILDDIQKLLYVGRGIAIISLGPLTFPEIPLSFLHSSGGAVGSLAGTWTAPNAVQVGNNGQQDGGYCMANSFIISPMVPFKVVLQFSSTVVTLNSGNVNLRISFDGNWYQPVM